VKIKGSGVKGGTKFSDYMTTLGNEKTTGVMTYRYM
jgi:aconitase B